MPEQKLKEQLQTLHDTLEQHPELDDETKSLMLKIAADIEAAEGDAVADLSDMVQEQAVQFEQEHPTLAGVLRQIVDTLGRIGV